MAPRTASGKLGSWESGRGIWKCRLSSWSAAHRGGGSQPPRRQPGGEQLLSSAAPSAEEAEALDWLDSYGTAWREPKPSNYYQEGANVNVDVAGAGATLALGLLFLKTGHKGVADLLGCPATLGGLDAVRPDLLQLRILAKALVEWEAVVPSADWVESQASPEVQRHILRIAGGEIDEGSFDVDEESVAQVRCPTPALSPTHPNPYAVSAGLLQLHCGSMPGLGLPICGLRQRASLQNSGSPCLSVRIGHNKGVPDLQLHFVRLFQPGNRGSDEAARAERRGKRWSRLVQVAGQFTIQVPSHSSPSLASLISFPSQACLRPVLSAIGAVMAGTGDLDALRLFRFVGGRVDSYASQLAVQQALGLLFLGGGRSRLFSKARNELSGGKSFGGTH